MERSRLERLVPWFVALAALLGAALVGRAFVVVPGLALALGLAAGGWLLRRRRVGSDARENAEATAGDLRAALGAALAGSQGDPERLARVGDFIRKLDERTTDMNGFVRVQAECAREVLGDAAWTAAQERAAAATVVAAASGDDEDDVAVLDEDTRTRLSVAAPEIARDLDVYLVHLRDGDEQLELLRATLREARSGGVRKRLETTPIRQIARELERATSVEAAASAQEARDLVTSARLPV
jgi:hypothetical protein